MNTILEHIRENPQAEVLKMENIQFSGEGSEWAFIDETASQLSEIRSQIDKLQRLILVTHQNRNLVAEIEKQLLLAVRYLPENNDKMWRQNLLLSAVMAYFGNYQDQVENYCQKMLLSPEGEPESVKNVTAIRRSVEQIYRLIQLFDDKNVAKMLDEKSENELFRFGFKMLLNYRLGTVNPLQYLDEKIFCMARKVQELTRMKSRIEGLLAPRNGGSVHIMNDDDRRVSLETAN